MIALAASIILAASAAAQGRPADLPRITSTRVADVRDFGARCDSKADDRVAIQRAMDVVARAGGGIVRLPAGSCLLASTAPKSPWGTILFPRAGVCLVGESGTASILRVAPGMNAVGGWVRAYSVLRQHHQDPESSATLDDACFRNFTIDMNGSENLLPAADSATKYNIAIGATRGARVLIENVTVLDNPGLQTFAFGGDEWPYRFHDLTIVGCTVRNVGSAVRGNANAPDHSAIYSQADRVYIGGNSFTNVAVAHEATCMELHHSHGLVEGNRCMRFGTGINLVSTVTDHVDSHVVGNAFLEVDAGAVFWTRPGHAMRDIALKSNRFLTQGAFHAIDLNEHVRGLIAGPVSLDHNEIRYIGGKSDRYVAGVEVGNVALLRVTGNTIRGYPARALQLGNRVDAGTVDVDVACNRIADVGTAATQMQWHDALAFNAQVGLKRVRLCRNVIENSGAGRIEFAGIAAPGARIVLTIGDESFGYIVTSRMDAKAIARHMARRLGETGSFRRRYAASALGAVVVISSLQPNVTTRIAAKVVGYRGTLVVAVPRSAFMTTIVRGITGNAPVGRLDVKKNDQWGVPIPWDWQGAKPATGADCDCTATPN